VRRVGAGFDGWPERAFEVLLRLEGEPTRTDREQLRADREQLVRRPMVALLDAVADADPAYADFSVWGFAKETWWWQHQGAVIRLGENLELALRFDLDGLYLKANWHHPGAEQLRRYRAAVAGPETGAELAAALAALAGRGYEITGDIMSRMPRGYPADHARAGLLRHRTLGAGRMLGHDDTLRTPAATDLVLAAAAELAPLTSWLVEHAIEPEPEPIAEPGPGPG
jgi:hypothetical protein